MAKFEDLVGKTLTDIKVDKTDEGDEVIFSSSDGVVYRMHHDQDCCETVYLEDVTGDFEDLIGSPILVAEEAVSDTPPEGIVQDYAPESQTWTFYKLATIKGYVDLRWFGESNGYYSEGVSSYEQRTSDRWERS